jgi:hypothetical protein
MESARSAKAASNWIPETDPHILGIIGKLGEEASELASRCCRATIQGLDGVDPGDGRPNSEHIADEIADVEAMIEIAKLRLDMDYRGIRLRRDRKIDFKLSWFNFLRSERSRR